MGEVDLYDECDEKGKTDRNDIRQLERGEFFHVSQRGREWCAEVSCTHEWASTQLR